MREEGDYMDWYCSGINGMADVTDEEYSQMSREAQESYLESKASVAEGTVTDEIRNDLLTIGWLVVD
jgi:DNA-directed RNA polymerase beta' subunit